MFSTWGGGLIEREALIKVKGLSEDGLFMKGGGGCVERVQYVLHHPFRFLWPNDTNL